MRCLVTCAAVAAATAIATSASAGVVDVFGGQTSVLLDTDTLSSAAGLTLNSASMDVGAGDLGADSVAFGINPTNGNLPTTFSYDPGDFLGSFGGTIEHTGSVFFDSSLGLVEVGNFTIGFDAARVDGLGGAASGFFVQSTVGVQAILFDIADPTELVASDTELRIGADLLVSDEFGSFLFDNGLAGSNLAGADVGDALVTAAVPAPGALAFLATGVICTRRRRRG
ncbi:MAG: hypothetical protein AAF432_08740 [Planctomycetota bacterium]